MTRTNNNNKSRLLFSAVAVALLATTVLQGVEASLSCVSPYGSYRVGDSVNLVLSGNDWWPRLKDVYSITANVYCSSGGDTVASMSISNGDTWEIPSSAYGRCSNNQMYVQYTGKIYDIAHIAHILPYWTSCGTMTVNQAPPPPPTTTNPPPPPTTTTRPPPPPTENPPPPTEPPTKPTTTGPTTTIATATTTYSPIYTTTYTLIPTVISGTSTVIPITTVIVVTPTLPIPPTVPLTGTTSGALDPDNSQLPGLPPPPPNGNNNEGSQRNSNNSNVPAAALGAVGGVAALALIVFGLVMTRKRRRMREEQANASKDNYYYDGTAFAAVSGGAGGAGARSGSGGHHSSDDMSLPSLHHAYPASGAGGAIHPPADGSTSYGGWDYDPSYAAAGTGASIAAGAGAGGGDGSTTLLPFPVPTSTSDALKQQYDLANRLSVVSQDSLMLGFPAVPTTPPQGPSTATAATVGSTAATATAAYALNRQMSLKQELDDEDANGGSSAGSPELYYLPVGEHSPMTTATGMTSQFVSARGSPGTTAASVSFAGGNGGGAMTRSSAYETVHSNSSAYATADSPSWSNSAASLQSHDIAIPMPPNAGSGSGYGHGHGGASSQANMRELIRDVLRDD
ncbi:hypothetical protein BGX23_009755 [Mortierella sp. AD031]|nr:hypothetical protein BGX23_009755 [Mortierella sp. AD031]